MCFCRTSKHKTDNNSPKVVYKTMRLLTADKVIPVHYYTNKCYPIGSTLRASKDVPVDEMDKLDIFEGEVVHAYISPDITKKHIDRLKECTAWCSFIRSKTVDIALVRCTIPKGTLYCIGHDDHLLDNYGALTIIPNEIIRVLTTVYR